MEILEKTMLNEGDWISVYRFGQAQRKIQIDRVTKIYAFDSLGWKYTRKLHKFGSVRALDDSMCPYDLYYLLTPEREVEYEEALERTELSEKFESLSNQITAYGCEQFTMDELRNIVNTLRQVSKRN